MLSVNRRSSSRSRPTVLGMRQSTDSASYTRTTRGHPTSLSNHIQHLLADMGLCLSTTSRLRSIEGISQGTCGMSQRQSPHIVSIHILDDDSLLHIFYLYRPSFLGEDEVDFDRLTGGREGWHRGRWWYQLTHVCRRWRNLILGSASYLHLSLICTNGTSVANMLAHSPPLPLTVDYSSEDGITAKDEEGVLLALEQRDRLRHLRLAFPVRDLQKLVMAIDEEFPILEYLILVPWVADSTALMLPESLQAPHLRHLMLRGFACPIRSRLHPTAAGLVALTLTTDHPSAYFQPNVLLQWISFMPQLETLAILFTFPVPNRDVERQLTHTPITTHITLPNLRFFWFRGVSAYLEAVVCRIMAPRLESLHIHLFKQLTFSVPRLLQFMNTTENLRFDNAKIMFKDKRIDVGMVFRHGEADSYTGRYYDFFVTIGCWHLDWQVSSVVQISNVLSQAFSAVEHLTFEHEVHSQSSEEHNDVDRIEWRELLRSFSNVKTLRVEDGLVEELSRCLRLEDGELPLELLPELQELTYFGSGDTGDAFTSFIDARQNAGRPVTLVRHSPSPSLLSFEPPAIMSPSDEAGNDIET
ncbi:hypothetical protein F5888DRAFT_1908565 [Russula emetica]|nr:hypothetical protein F5888DRAFT_1908565 [Russula emetica]